MSSTRRAARGAPLRQERFVSSAASRRGLLGNLVARRCESLRPQKEREIIYFLHELSLRDGFGVHRSCNLFPAWPWPSTVGDDETALQRVARELTEFFPEQVVGCPARARRRIFSILPRLCLDPSFPPAGAAIDGFRDLLGALCAYRAKFESAIAPLVASTQVKGTIFEALNFALEQRDIVLLEGEYRSGKSFCSQAWCLQHLGESRYVQLSSANSDTDFYREIARAVGAASGMEMKAIQMRLRIEETLRGQHLLLCIDEADWILGTGLRLRQAPQRLNWLMTAISNHGTPVALIGSRNFSRLLRNIEARCPIWGAEQFYGRLRLRKGLPGSLSENDLLAIARLMLPNADTATLMLLVGFALESKGRVSALENAVVRGRFFARRQNRAVAFEDIEEAMREAGYEFPNDAATTVPRRPLDRTAPSHRQDFTSTGKRLAAVPQGDREGFATQPRAIFQPGTDDPLPERTPRGT